MTIFNAIDEHIVAYDSGQVLSCARRREQMLADLNALDDRQLREIGVWRGAIASATDDTLSRQGCPTDKV